MVAGCPKQWTDAEIVEAKELYLQLLSLGMKEYEIDKVDTIPGHTYRSVWSHEKEFAELCSRARAYSAQHILEKAEERQELTYQMALDEAASPQLVAIVKEMSQHARWKAAKYNREVYGDKQSVDVNHTGSITHIAAALPTTLQFIEGHCEEISLEGGGDNEDDVPDRPLLAAPVRPES